MFDVLEGMLKAIKERFLLYLISISKRIMFSVLCVANLSCLLSTMVTRLASERERERERGRERERERERERKKERLRERKKERERECVCV